MTINRIPAPYAGPQELEEYQAGEVASLDHEGSDDRQADDQEAEPEGSEYSLGIGYFLAPSEEKALDDAPWAHGLLFIRHYITDLCR